MSASPWWKWDWDRSDVVGYIVGPKARVTRWRRGWVTLYRITKEPCVEWRLYLPFNINVGIDVAAADGSPVRRLMKRIYDSNRALFEALRKT